MGPAEKKANEIKDFLYAQGVRTNDEVHLNVWPSADGSVVLVNIHPNSRDCDACRSRGLARRAVDAARQAVSPSTCTGCRKQAESNGVHQRAMLTRVSGALAAQYTVTDEYAGDFITNLKVAV